MATPLSFASGSSRVAFGCAWRSGSTPIASIPIASIQHASIQHASIPCASAQLAWTQLASTLAAWTLAAWILAAWILAASGASPWKLSPSRPSASPAPSPARSHRCVAPAPRVGRERRSDHRHPDRTPGSCGNRDRCCGPRPRCDASRASRDEPVFWPRVSSYWISSVSRASSKPMTISPSIVVVGVACEPRSISSLRAASSSRTFLDVNSTPRLDRNSVTASQGGQPCWW